MTHPYARSGTSNTSRIGNWTWLWLGYSGFLFIKPIFAPSFSLWVRTVSVFVVFLVVFTVYNGTANETTRRWMIAATFLLGLITFPWNTGGSTFFVYTAAFLPFAVASSSRLVSLFALESVFVLAEGYFVHDRDGLPNAVIAVFLLIIIGGGNIFFAEQRRAQSRLAAAQQENLALAAVAERERIARDLHDVLGHTLSVIVLKAELAGRILLLNPERAAAEVADVERIARAALVDVREAIGGYRARGLAAEIECARLTLDAAGVTLSLDSDSSATGSLTPQEETALSLALREAVTNIVRHAQATQCRLRFVTEAGCRRVVVEDNGQHAATHEGNGLRGMRERVEFLGGQLSIERNPEAGAPGLAPAGRGTRLTIDLPLRPHTNPST